MTLRWLLGVGLALSSVRARAGHAQTVQPQDTLPGAHPIASPPWDSARAGWQGRLVVGEYLTGVFCGPCQDHDEAFNKLLQHYPASAFVSLAYHGAGAYNPLMDPTDTIAVRVFAWYGFPGAKEPSQQGMFGSHATFDNWIDGRSTDQSGTSTSVVLNSQSPAANPDRQYEAMRQAIDAELRRPPEAFVHLAAVTHGGTVVACVRLDSVTGQHPALFLRLALVEDTVNLVSTSHIVLRRQHHMVVRSVASTKQLLLGLPVHVQDTVRYVFDVAALQRRLMQEYQYGLAVARVGSKSDSLLPAETQGTADADDVRAMMTSFPTQQDWRINPRRLHVIAFVQDAHSGDVLQAAMVTVAPDATGARLALP